MDISKKFGKRLQEIRKMRGLTQDKLSELVNIDVTNISRIENGTQFPRKENIEELAKILNVEIKELFNFKHYNSKQNIIDDINTLLNNATLKDVQFIQKVVVSYFECK